MKLFFKKYEKEELLHDLFKEEEKLEDNDLFPGFLAGVHEEEI